MTLHTTFALLKEHGACVSGYHKLAEHLGGVTHYGKDKHIPLAVVLDSNGLDDALWCLRAVLPEEAAQRDREARLLACDFSEHVLPLYESKYPNDSRPRDCIAVARRFAVGNATQAELHAAWDAAGAAAWDAAGDAARAAARAWAAARAAAGDAELEWQTEQFRKMLEGATA